MVVTLPRDSHKNKQKYQIDYDDAARLLGPDFQVIENGQLPVKTSSSKFAIIGGGFGGIATSLKILKTLKSDDFVIFEKYNNFGGTWLVNKYPGAASDIPAAWYSFSDELNSNWSCPQPPQYEIEEYVMKVVEKYQLPKYAKFNTIVTQCKWIETNQHWELTTTDLNTGQKTIHTSQFIINCIGGLAQVSHFEAPGLENFAGEYMHTAIWNDSVNLKDKNIIVVGNGCSATQLIPYLIRDYDVKSVTQIVRSKHYILPPLPSILQQFYELFSYTWLGLFIVRMVIIIVGEMKWPMFKGDGIISNFVRNRNYQLSINYMNRECPEEYKLTIIPSFTIGCKRLIIDHDYLQTLHDSKMDIKPSTIAKVKPRSVVLQDGTELAADVIIACTGYNVSKTVKGVNFIGRDGINVQDYWQKEGVSAYKTILLKHCPNVFVIGGVCIKNISRSHEVVARLNYQLFSKILTNI